MERELWKKVYRLVMETAKNKTIKRATFTNAQIILTYLWAVIHDRPVYWACDKKNWPIYYRRRALPTPSTMTRRLRRCDIQQILKDIELKLVNKFPRSTCRWVDGKPLAIGGASKDRQSKFGFGASCVCRGYKLHAIADQNQGFVRWTITPMNESESHVASKLVGEIEEEGYLIGDGNYDKTHLYNKAAERNIQLVAPQRIRNAKGLGHRRQSEHRLRGMELVKRSFGESLLECRRAIERMFGNLVTFCGGLKPLPHWVRTLPRVRRWVQAKMILFHLWRTDKMAARLV